MALVASFFVLANAVSSSQHDRPQRVILITIDGFDAAYLNQDVPNLKALMHAGASCDHATTVFPSVTTANFYSILTGCYPDHHTIPANHYFDLEQDKRIDAPRGLAVPTIAELLKQHKLTTAAVGLGMLREVVDFYDPAKEQQAERALALIDRQRPDFLGLYYPDPDSMGHAFGPRSTPVRKAVSKTDEEIGRLVAGLRERHLLQSSLLIVVSDHGMTELNPLGTLNLAVANALSRAQVKWEVVESNGVKPDTEVVWIRSSRCAMLTMRRKITIEREAALVAALRALKGVSEVLAAKELNELHASQRLGDYVILPKPGYHFASVVERGGHGSKEEMCVPLIIAGPGVRPNLRLESARTIDVVPTILRSLNVPLPAHMQGSVLDVFQQGVKSKT